MRAAAFAVLLGSLSGAARAGPRVVSLDQCADQFVLAISPRANIAGLSTRARNRDSFLARAAVGLPEVRADAEAVLGVRPTVAVRFWGGSPELVRALERRGIAVVGIDDANDFAGVSRNVRRVSAALGERARGEALISRMEVDLALARGAWKGRSALYLTPGGGTSGAGTLVDSILGAAGLSNAAGGRGYREIPLERLVLDPPAAVVRGFFEPWAMALQPWAMGRHTLLRRAVGPRSIVSVPGAELGCPAWFAADAARRIAATRPS